MLCEITTADKRGSIVDLPNLDVPVLRSLVREYEEAFFVVDAGQDYYTSYCFPVGDDNHWVCLFFFPSGAGLHSVECFMVFGMCEDLTIAEIAIAFEQHFGPLSGYYNMTMDNIALSPQETN